MMKKALLAWVVGISFFYVTPASSKTFNTLDAMGSALNMECIDYCIVGICIHFRCDPFCRTWTSPRVTHNLPEFIVSVYDEVDEQPYTEYKPFQKLLFSWMGSKGAGLMQQDKLNSQPLIFKNASVIGHPFLLFADPPTKQTSVVRLEDPGVSNGIYVWDIVEVPNFTNAQMEMGAKIDETISSSFSLIRNNPIFKGFCPSNIEFFKPYYESNLDFFEWRFGVIDRIKAVQSGAHLPGRREIGSLNGFNPIGKNTWGAVYPRMGFVMQNEDPKAAAVIAQRAVDIVTRSDSWRISKYAAVGASNEKTDKWQMISPKEDSSCRTFGSKDPNWSKGRNPDGKGQYAWNYWGSYSCCLGGGSVVQVIPTPNICLKDIF